MRRRSRLHLATACYVGIAALIAVTVLMDRVLPCGVGIPVFVVAMIALVGWMHPRIYLTRRN